MIINFRFVQYFDLNLKILSYLSILRHFMIISCDHGRIVRVLKFCGKIITSLQ